MISECKWKKGSGSQRRAGQPQPSPRAGAEHEAARTGKKASLAPSLLGFQGLVPSSRLLHNEAAGQHLQAAC